MHPPTHPPTHPHTHTHTHTHTAMEKGKRERARYKGSKWESNRDKEDRKRRESWRVTETKTGKACKGDDGDGLILL